MNWALDVYTFVVITHTLSGYWDVDSIFKFSFIMTKVVDMPYAYKATIFGF